MMKPFSYSQTLLALAIGFLALSLFKFTLYLPDILKTIEKTTQTVDSVSAKVDSIVDEVANVRAVVSKQTPAILSQVEATLPVVQGVIDESKSYSKQLPELLKQIAHIEKRVTSLQADMPAILMRVDAIVKMTNNTTAEVARWRPHSSLYLKEIELSREYIPRYLSRVEQTVHDAKNIGKEASSGMVSGLFKGVITLPFEVVSGLTGIVDADSRSAKYLTAQDVNLMQEKVISLLNDDNQTKTFWQNKQSGNRGTIIKGEASTRHKQKCFHMSFNNHFGKEKETLKELMCADDKGLWRVI